MTVRLIEGDCRRSCMLSADAAVTDPPYELGFMSKGWDRTGVAFRPETWYAVLRALPPGGYMACFGGTRTYHRLTCAVEDAGFEIRDCLLWLYGTGFPKGKGCLKPAYEPILLARRPGPRVLPLGIDECRVEGAPPKVTGRGFKNGRRREREGRDDIDDSVKEFVQPAGRYPANLAHDGSAEVLGAFAAFGPAGGGFGVRGKKDNDRGFQPNAGWGMKNTGETVGFGDFGTAARFFACCPLDWRCVVCGTGEKSWYKTLPVNSAERNFKTTLATVERIVPPGVTMSRVERTARAANTAANLCDSCAIAFALALVETQSSGSSSGALRATQGFTTDSRNYSLIRSLASVVASRESTDTIPTTASLARLFGTVLPAIDDFTRLEGEARGADDNSPEEVMRFRYQSKASKKERGEGNDHPTVKPLALMRWLVKLVCPPGGTVLDPFAGSGTTGAACMREERSAVLVENDAHSCDIIRRRLGVP